ncbi:hypothetical protein Bca4012_066955 [Brassica carinata]
MMMASSSSSSSLAPSWLYDVFLNFRGADVRKGLLSHVLKEFKSKGINVFIDNEIERGESVGPELVTAIRQSRVAVVLLSPKYASSSWCLDELVEIMKCRKEYQQTVMTIFYQVNPSDVRNQTGDFGKAFDETCVGKTEEVKQAWRLALNDVASIAGYDPNNCDNEADMINKVASDVMTVLGFTPSKDFDDFVGMGARMVEIKSKLILQSEQVKVIGIFGPAGIGKTTAARVLYNQLSPDFPFSTFLEDIRGSYEKPCGNDYQLKLRFQKNMLPQIFNKGDIEVHHLGRAQEMLSDKKVLIVLDEVDCWWQLEEMANRPGWVGPGSMIIITTEDRKLLNTLGLGSDHIYRMIYPTRDESLQILCQYAFGQKFPNDGFESLAWEITWLAGDLPLGLRVMGSYLRGMSRDDWIKALPSLRSTLNGEIESTLRFSYEALGDNEKTLFLHIAGALSGFEVDSVKRYLANSRLEVNHGLDVLAQKSLIYINNKVYVEMHRLLQQMGREIVKKQCLENHGKPQFLTDTKDICDALNEDIVAGNVLGIRTWHMNYNIQINKSAFKGMNSLQFLIASNILLPEGLDCFPDKLRLLLWTSCPLRVWPSKFSGKFLVEIHLGHSKFERLWKGIKPLPCLKKLDLSYSTNLKKIPDLSEATSLEELVIPGCQSLLELPNFIGNATKLYRLDTRGCTKIKDFPNVSHSIVRLDLSQTRIKEVPPRIENLFRLRKLKMYGCKKLKTISPNISKLENLESLGLSNNYVYYSYYGCRHENDSDVDEFDDVFEAIIKWGPDFKKHGWIFRSGFKVDYILPKCLPEKAFTSPISLRLGGDGIKTIPDYIRHLPGLTELDVKECRELVALPPLPDSLVSLNAQRCYSLKRIDSSSFQNPDICLNFAKCFKLKQEARKLIQTSACKYAFLPGEDVPAHFTHRASSGSLTINSTSIPLPSSFRFKACILLSKVNDLPEESNGDEDDTDDDEGENLLTTMSYSVRGKQNGLTVGGGSNQLDMPVLYRPSRLGVAPYRPDIYGYGEHLYIFEESFTPEAEETTFSELTFAFRVDDNTWNVKGCGVRLLGANNESAGCEDDDDDDNGEEDDDDDDDDSGEEDDDDDDDDEDSGDDDDESGDSDNNKVAENDYPHSSDSLSNQSSPFSCGTPSSGGPIRYPSAFPQNSIPQFSSLSPRTYTDQTFGYNQGGPSINPQSGTRMTSYPSPNLMQSGCSRPFYGNTMHLDLGGDKPQNMLPVPQSLNPHSIPQQLPSMQLSQIQRPMQLSQIQRPMQPPQHVRPSMQISQPSEQGVPLQNQYQIPLYPMQMMQQRQFQPYYHPPQQQYLSQVQQQAVQDLSQVQQQAFQGQQGASLQNQYQIPLYPMQMMQQTQVQPYYHPPQQQEIFDLQQQTVQGQQGASLQNQYQIPLYPMQIMQQTQVQPYYHPPQQQEIFDLQQQTVQGQQGVSLQNQYQIPLQMMQQTQVPEPIQALLSNREKLCELLEQDPKLMQMLQLLSTRKRHSSGDRSTSDIVVRLRNEEGRDDWIYCHSKILTERSRYFADRLSDKWPTCKILDSRYCVEVICQESDYDHHINLLRLLYAVFDHVTEDQLCHNVKSALGILCVAKELDCPMIVAACVSYLEAVPWEEGEEEEMLRVILMIGPEAEPVLARLQPVDQSAVSGIFSSAFKFATSSPPLPLCDIKASAQEQIEYMITEDDDGPFLIADEVIKLEVKECVKSLFARFFQYTNEDGNGERFCCNMGVETSEKLVKVVEAMESAAETVEIRVKVIEVTSKVVEAIGYGTVILPTVKRLQMVKLWLPFVRETKPLVDSAVTNQEQV